MSLSRLERRLNTITELSAKLSNLLWEDEDHPDRFYLAALADAIADSSKLAEEELRSADCQMAELGIRRQS